MDYRTTVPVMLLIMVLFMFMNETSKVNQLQNRLDGKDLTIDSLKHEIDTLRWESEIRYNYDDRWVRYKSIQMFNVYCKHYNLNTAEEIARCWNGGPRGMQNEMTVGYWKKVSTKLDI